MKVTRLTSKDLLVELYGPEAVQHYEQVKAGSMHLGDKIARELIKAVGGRAGTNGDPYDGITRLGQWEFCLQRNSKNSAGNAHDLQRAPGRCVQILEEPNHGWMSAEDFLTMHGHPPTVLLDIIQTMRDRYVLHQQLRLTI